MCVLCWCLRRQGLCSSFVGDDSQPSSPDGLNLSAPPLYILFPYCLCAGRMRRPDEEETNIYISQTTNTHTDWASKGPHCVINERANAAGRTKQTDGEVACLWMFTQIRVQTASPKMQRRTKGWKRVTPFRAFKNKIKEDISAHRTIIDSWSKMLCAYRAGAHACLKFTRCSHPRHIKQIGAH